MPSSSGIKAGRAYVTIGGDDRELRAVLARSATMLKSFASGVASAGFALGTTIAGGLSAAAVGVTYAGKQFAAFGSQLNDMSGRTGVSVEALSELSYAAGQTGTDLATVETGVRKMQSVLTDAAAGSQSAAAAFEKLGVNVRSLAGLAPENQFRTIATALGNVQDATTRAALAVDVFGRSGTALLPMIADFDALTRRARELGLTMDAETARAADALGDAFDDLKLTTGSVVRAVGSAFAPRLQQAAEWLTNAAVATAAFVQENRGAVDTVLAVAGGVGAIGAGALALSLSIKTAGFALGGFVTIGSTAASVLSLLGSGAAALATPMGLATAGVVAFGGALVYWSGAGGAALAWLGETFNTVSGIASTAASAVVNALKSGNFKAAAEVATKSIYLIWLEATRDLKQLWLKLKFDGTAAFLELGAGMQIATINAMAGIRKSLGDFGGWMAKTQTRTAAGVEQTWNNALEGIAKAAVAAKEAAGGITAEEAAGAYQAISATFGEANAQIDRETAAHIAEIEGNRAARVKEIEAVQAGRIAMIGRQLATSLAMNQGDAADAIKAAQQAIDDARADFDDAVAAVGGGTPGLPPPPGLQNFQAAAVNIPDVLAAAKTSFAGTFVGAALSGLGGADDTTETLQRSLRALKEIARNTEGLSFGDR